MDAVEAVPVNRRWRSDPVPWLTHSPSGNTRIAARAMGRERVVVGVQAGEGADVDHGATVALGQAHGASQLQVANPARRANVQTTGYISEAGRCLVMQAVLAASSAART